MEEEILNYDEIKQNILEKTEIGDRLLLLGNGFSIAYSKDRFSFTSLLERAVEKNVIKENGNIHQVFKQINTKDFEFIIKTLEDSSKVLSIYDNQNSCIKEMSNDSIRLKKFLVDVITNNHPEKSTVIDDDAYKNTMDFLKDYGVIYTLNYDLLLYWTLMKYKDNPKYEQYTDGFTRDLKTEDECHFITHNSRKKIHYLHGCLCFFDNHTTINKKIYKEDQPLKDQILQSLESNFYPVFVSEGSSHQKLTKILHNIYLNSCYRSLQTKGKVIVIYGTYLKQNDTHIQDAIIENPNITTICIAVKNKDSLEEIQPFIARLKTYEKETKNLQSKKYSKNKKQEYQPKEIIFFYRDGIRLWNQ